MTHPLTLHNNDDDDDDGPNGHNNNTHFLVALGKFFDRQNN